MSHVKLATEKAVAQTSMSFLRCLLGGTVLQHPKLSVITASWLVRLLAGSLVD